LCLTRVRRFAVCYNLSQENTETPHIRLDGEVIRHLDSFRGGPFYWEGFFFLVVSAIPLILTVYKPRQTEITNLKKVKS
jgi:hypothetical protein